MTTVDQLHVYADTNLKYRWSYVAANGPVLADSGQGYVKIGDARHGFSIVNRAVLSKMPLYQLEWCEKHAGARCLVWQIVRRPEEPPSPALADVRAEARAEALRETADKWQWGEWTVLTPKIHGSTDNAQRVLAAAQAVTDWLRARASMSDERANDE